MNNNDIELMQQALDALEVSTTPLAKDRQKVLLAQVALRARLSQQAPEPHIAVRHSNGLLDFEKLHLKAKQRAEKEAALTWPEGDRRKKLQEELTDRYFYEYTAERR